MCHNIIYSVVFVYAETTFTTIEVFPAVLRKTAGLFLSTNFYPPPFKQRKSGGFFNIFLMRAFALRQTRFFCVKRCRIVAVYMYLRDRADKDGT